MPDMYAVLAAQWNTTREMAKARTIGLNYTLGDPADDLTDAELKNFCQIVGTARRLQRSEERINCAKLA